MCGLYEYADLNPDVCAWVAMSVSAWPVVGITLLLNLARLFGLDPMLVCCPDVCAWEGDESVACRLFCSLWGVSVWWRFVWFVCALWGVSRSVFLVVCCIRYCTWFGVFSCCFGCVN